MLTVRRDKPPFARRLEESKRKENKWTNAQTDVSRGRSDTHGSDVCSWDRIFCLARSQFSRMFFFPSNFSLPSRGNTRVSENEESQEWISQLVRKRFLKKKRKKRKLHRDYSKSDTLNKFEVDLLFNAFWEETMVFRLILGLLRQILIRVEVSFANS